MEKRVVFTHKVLPYLLLAPQLAITVVFFFLPAGQAMWQSFHIEDPFGLSSQFVGLSNFADLFTNSDYINSFEVTAVFSILVAVLGLSISLLLAAMADRVVKAAAIYKTLLIWPYAVATAVAGVLWTFMFSPSVGVIAVYLARLGFAWNPRLDGYDAMALVVLASVWKQISYNFLFFLAGLQSIPRSLIEAAAIDGASPSRRFWWTDCSQRVSCTCMKIKLTAASMRLESSARRTPGSDSVSSRRWKVSISAKVEGVSLKALMRTLNWVCDSLSRQKCAPWPSSWASVSTSCSWPV